VFVRTWLRSRGLNAYEKMSRRFDAYPAPCAGWVFFREEDGKGLKID